MILMVNPLCTMRVENLKASPLGPLKPELLSAFSMGNRQGCVVISGESGGKGGQSGQSTVNPNCPNLLFDLPLSLVLEIYTNWLSGGEAAMRDMIRLDTALCNKKARSLLSEVCKAVNFDGFLLSDNGSLVERKMKWATHKQIKFVDLEIQAVGLDHISVLFFAQNAPNLKTLRIRENTRFMAHWFQNCTTLETLLIEDCPINIDISQILNTCPIKYLKLNNKAMFNLCVPSRLLQLTHCTTVTRLSLLDRILPMDYVNVTQSFPNVVDFEMRGISRYDRSVDGVVVLSNLCRMWPNLHTLRIHDFQFPSDGVYDVLTELCPNLKRFYLVGDVSCNDQTLFQFLTTSANITCIKLDYQYTNALPTHQFITQLVVSKAALLVEFRIGYMMLGGDTLAAISTHCPNLRVLEANTYNHPSKWSAMCEIYRKCPLLFKLYISLHNVASDGLIQQLLNVKYCANLQALHLAGSTYVEYRDIVNLVSHCKSLKFIETNNPNITHKMGSVYNGVKIAFKMPDA